MKNVNFSKPYNLMFTTKCNDSSILNYDFFMRLFELVVAEWICWRRHNLNPGYQV